MKKYVVSIFISLSIFSYIYAAEVGTIGAYKQELEGQQNDLQILEQEINDYRKSLLSLGVKEKNINKVLKKVESDSKKVKTEIKDIELAIKGLIPRINTLENALKNKKNLYNDYQTILKESIKLNCFRQRRRDKYSKHKYLLKKYKSEKCSERLLIDLPYNICIDLENRIDRDVRLQKNLLSERKKLLNLENQLDKKQKSLIKQNKKQLMLLANIRVNKTDASRGLKKLEEEKAKLGNLIGKLKVTVKNLERLNAISANFTNAKGKLPWPLDGSIVSSFGKHKHPQLETYIINRGIKIRSKTAVTSKILSVSAGEIVYSDSFEGMGNMVVIDHGNGYYTVYGNLKKILVATGQEVDILTTVGEIENKALYFEIGKGNQAQDPLTWLIKK